MTDQGKDQDRIRISNLSIKYILYNILDRYIIDVTDLEFPEKSIKYSDDNSVV